MSLAAGFCGPAGNMTHTQATGGGNLLQDGVFAKYHRVIGGM